MRRSAPSVLTVLLVLACSNAGSNLTFPPIKLGVVEVSAFLDRDASTTLNGADTAYVGARVEIRPFAGGRVLRTQVTSSLGIARFEDVAIGEYFVTIDLTSLGDTLHAAAVDPLKVEAGDGITPVTVRLAYNEASIAQVRQLPLGTRIMIRGLILAGVQSFRDTTAHVADNTGQIRLTRVSLRGGSIGNNPGDSVLVVGTVSTRAGQSTLDLALVTQVGTRPAPIPFSVTTATAASAMGGSLDAALVLITAAVITDTATVGPDFRVVGNDGSGPVSVILDAFGGFNRQLFIPGRPMTVRGVLVPDGSGKWLLKPRNPGDVAVF